MARQNLETRRSTKTFVNRSPTEPVTGRLLAFETNVRNLSLRPSSFTLQIEF
jgi:hypothetical protein